MSIKIIEMIILILLLALLAVLGYLFTGTTKEAEDISWGVNFSQKHTENLGLDWKETYLALLDDLGIKNIKIAVHWDLIEPNEGEYYFGDLDWQIQKAEEKDVKTLLVIGMKTPRWPECHIPNWAVESNKESQQKSILELLEKIVLRYKGENSIWAWQIENEPFFAFGDCPWYDEEFLKKEIELVKSLDNRSVIISDTGEFSFWFKSAKLGDIVGITMYRKVWSKEIKRYIGLPFPATFYSKRAYIVKKLFNKDVICVELQAEPWGPSLLYDSPIEEQAKTMNIIQFRKNIKFARKTGLDKFYFWGAEWWYWMKEKQEEPDIWNEAKKLFK